jgi:hypothetical protein
MTAEIEPTAKPLCGDCKFFDPQRNDGELVGTTLGQDGKEIKLGFCRTSMGTMKWGPNLTEETPCRQPEGVFQPKEAVESPSAA